MKRRPSEQRREWDADRLYAYGLRLLSFRARSEREIRQRFTARGATGELIEPVLERLREGGLVDDKAFAEAWVESRRRASPRGARVLQRELLQKGLDRGMVDEALTAGAPDELDLARAAAAKKGRALASLPADLFARRLTEFLLRRGFEYETTATVVRELLAERGADAD